MTPDPEFRRDPVTGRHSIIAPERALRPIALEGAEPRHRTDGERQPCPFCEGNECETPSEVLAYRQPGTKADSPGWQLRVVPNKFPAVRPFPPGIVESNSELFERTPAYGLHELVIETPRHVNNPLGLTDAEFAAVFHAYRDRLLSFAADPRLKYASIFKNLGAEAGASLGHTHSQIVVTSLIPENVQAELDGAAAYHAASGRCVFCDVLTADRADGSRVIAETSNFLAVAAFAPRFAYEMWLLPKAHASRYETIGDAFELAGLMRKLLFALDAVLAEPAYNWFLHTSPLRTGEPASYHWHFELFPRTDRKAGFEWATGCDIVAISPERAAAALRAAREC